MYIVWGLTD